MCLTAVSTESKEFFAEAVTRPSTSAVIVATMPMPSFTVSLVASVMW